MNNIKNIIFGTIVTSMTITILCNDTTSEDRAYKEYCKQQDKMYKEISKISGARPLNIDISLAEAVLEKCPDEINMAIARMKQNRFRDNERNIILYGLSGTGKSCIAQAMAIKSNIACLFFNVGTISTEYMNSGVQNLNNIFEYAKNLKKPCVVIFDELESLTKKHVDKNNHENNILISFWQELDKLKNSEVAFIGTMNSVEDLPVQITNRTSMIKVPLPKAKDKDAILSYHIKSEAKKYDIVYPDWIYNRYIEQKEKQLDTEKEKNDFWVFDLIHRLCLHYGTIGFCHRDLQNVVIRATAPAVSGRNNGIVESKLFTNAIIQIRKDPKRKLEREIGTWRQAFKKTLNSPKAIPIVFGITGLYVSYNIFMNQKVGLALQKEGLDQSKKISEIQMLQSKEISDKQMLQSKEIADKQMLQSKEISDKQMSYEQMSTQSMLNASIPIFGSGISIPIGAPIYGLIKGWDGLKWVYSKLS